MDLDGALFGWIFWQKYIDNTSKIQRYGVCITPFLSDIYKANTMELFSRRIGRMALFRVLTQKIYELTGAFCILKKKNCESKVHSLKLKFVEGGLREIVKEYAGRVLLLWQENNDDA